MDIKVYLDSTDIAKILGEAWVENDHYLKMEHKHQRIRHLLRLKVKDRIDKALDEAAYEIASEVNNGNV